MLHVEVFRRNTTVKTGPVEVVSFFDGVSHHKAVHQCVAPVFVLEVMHRLVGVVIHQASSLDWIFRTLPHHC